MFYSTRLWSGYVYLWITCVYVFRKLWGDARKAHKYWLLADRARRPDPMAIYSGRTAAKPPYKCLPSG